MTNAIEVEDVHKVFRAKDGELVRALDGISFQVPQGRIYGLLGPHGAGKSTLVKILSTITPLASGRASVMGFDVMRQGFERMLGGSVAGSSWPGHLFSRDEHRTCPSGFAIRLISILGVGSTTPLLLEGAATLIFGLICLAFAVRALNRAD